MASLVQTSAFLCACSPDSRLALIWLAGNSHAGVQLLRSHAELEHRLEQKRILSALTADCELTLLFSVVDAPKWPPLHKSSSATLSTGPHICVIWFWSSELGACRLHPTASGSVSSTHKTRRKPRITSERTRAERRKVDNFELSFELACDLKLAS